MVHRTTPPGPDPPGQLRIALFGAVSAWRGGAEVDLGGPKPRAALAALLLASPRPVHRHVLIDTVWGEDLPVDPRRDLRTLISRLRGALGRSAIVTVPAGGYRSAIPRRVLDVGGLEAALELSGGADGSGDAVRALRDALAATAGEPLGDISSRTPALVGLARSLEERRSAAEDRLAELLVCNGAAAEAIVLLERLVAETPLNEERWALLMEVLARSGRRGEALRCYQRAREALVSTLGIEPGLRLRSLEATLLADDPVHDAASSGGSDASTSLPPAFLRRRVPDTCYVDVDGLSIAYQVWGDGPIDVVLVPQLVSHLEVMLDAPGYRDWIESIAAFSRLVVFDKRGNGMSDRMVGPLPLEKRIADIGAVMDATGLRRAALLGASEGAAMSLLFAALHPERVTCVVTAGGMAAGRLAAGWLTEAEHDEVLERIRTTWGTGNDWWIYELAAPSLRDAGPSVRRQYERLNRMSSTPAGAAFLWDMYGRIDVRPALPMIECPVLVQHREGEPLMAFAPAQMLGGIRRVEQSVVPGHDHAMWVGDVAAYVAPIRSFLLRHAASPLAPRRRRLTTVVAAGVRSATGEHGGRSYDVEPDRRAFPRLRDQVTRFAGQLVQLGDGELVACFDLPTDALGCAAALRDLAAALDVELRCGVHTGEVEDGDDGTVAGPTVDVASELRRRARPGDALVSDLTRQLGLGSIYRFESCDHEDVGFDALAVARLHV